MLLIGNGCFGELSIILRVTLVCVFFHSIYNNISTGINCPGVSCEYDTYLILLNMYVQIILFASIFGLVDCNSLLCTFSVVYCHFCICWSALLSLRLACCVVWSGGISSVSPVIELSYFLFYLLLCRCRCLSVNNLWMCCG